MERKIEFSIAESGFQLVKRDATNISFLSRVVIICVNVFKADKAVAEKKLSAAKPALEEAEAALQVCVDQCIGFFTDF